MASYLTIKKERRWEERQHITAVHNGLGQCLEELMDSTNWFIKVIENKVLYLPTILLSIFWSSSIIFTYSTWLLNSPIPWNVKLRFLPFKMSSTLVLLCFSARTALKNNQYINAESYYAFYIWKYCFILILANLPDSDHSATLCNVSQAHCISLLIIF